MQNLALVWAGRKIALQGLCYSPFRCLKTPCTQRATSPTARFFHVQNSEVRVLRAFKVSGGMGLSVRLAARLCTCFQHPVHPLLLKRRRVVCSLTQEPKP